MGQSTVRVQGADATANSGALAKSLIALAAPGRLFSVTVWNESGADVYIQLHDSATVPADTAVPKIVTRCLASSERAVDYGDGRIFALGIVIVVSSTSATKTITLTDDCIIDCTYRAK